MNPTGSVSFSFSNNNNSNPISGCQNVALSGVQAACLTAALLPGSDAVQASFTSNDKNYSNDGGADLSLTQTVEYFQLGGLPTAAAIIQGSNNINTPYYPPTLTVMLAATNPPGVYGGKVNLTCAVGSMVDGAPTCTVLPITSPVTGSAMLTVSTQSTTPIGPYTVTVTGQDANISNAPTTQTSVLVNVGSLSTPKRSPRQVRPRFRFPLSAHPASM